MRKKIDDEAPPEADRFGEAPHPRNTFRLYGHAAAEAQFLDAYRAERLPQAWVIGGREGAGKATLAWRFARFLLAHPDPHAPDVAAAADLHVAPEHPAARRISAMSHADLFLLRREWNEKSKKAYTEIRMDDVRRGLEMFHHAAADGGWRIAIIDAAEDLNRSSANALLKMIEEPPPRSLFLIVSHTPSRLLPTIRSRCRMLLLETLSAANVVSAIRDMDEIWEEYEASDIEKAAERAGGSVRDALRLLGGGTLALAGKIDGLLERLPALNWMEVHDIADQVQKRDGSDDFDAVLSNVYDWLDRRVIERAGADAPARLARYAEVWEKVSAEARETEALNLDRRPLILSIFAKLSEAARN